MPHESIEMNPDIMGGKPVVRGTRVPVELILPKLGAGMSPESILADHLISLMKTSSTVRLER
jgi:uncharacterized protein (DUF433 family)